ncbi:MAG: hypothetical protein K5894_09495 [Lachnospiraceae bacterium]|nr:hypothetical protein [Lachnospiraceae bacterium]
MAELIRERYKVECILRESPNYAALRVVDIEEREKNTYLLNAYSGDNIKQYVKTFHDLKNCPEYKGNFVDEGRFYAVFSYKSGENIDNVFKKKSLLKEEFRFHCVDQILNKGLASESYPDDVKYRVILHENFLVKQASERVEMNFFVDPAVYNQEYVDTLKKEIRKILPKSFTEPISEREFFLYLDKRPAADAVELYARWKKAFPLIDAEYKRQVNMPFIERIFSILIKNIKWFFKSRFIGREER